MKATTLIALALSSVAGAQTTWYVDVHATPPGLGTPASPYASIQYAVTRPTTVPGDTILVAPGTYVENVLVNVIDYMHGLGVHVVAVGGPLVTELRPATNAETVRVISYYSTIEGFTLTGASGSSSCALSLDMGIATRCIVRNNAGLAVYSDSGILRECTIVDNRFGILEEFFGGVSMRNTIVWGNQDYDFSFGPFPPDGHYCAGALPSTTTGVGNIVGDPGLWDVAGSHHLLRPGSPCIDAGDPSAPLDPDGSRADIGAVPYDASYAPPPTSYCTAKTNSLGCVPSIGAVGTASASGAPFTITCVNELSHKFGLLFYGFAPKNAAYQGGYLCVQSPVHRTGLLDAGGTVGVVDCSGVYAFDFDALIQSGGDPALVAGAIVYAQFWSRDPAASFTTVRSDGLRLCIAP